MSGEQEQPAASGRRGRAGMWVCVVAVGALLAVGIAWVAIAHREKAVAAREDAVVAKLAADGLPVTQRALFPAPKGKNGAPALLRAFGRLAKLGGPERKALLDAHLEWTDPDRWKAQDGPASKAAAAHAKALAAAQPTVHAIDGDVKAALAADCVAWDVDWSRGYLAKWPTFSRLRQVMQVLELHALQTMYAGHAAAAWAEARRMLALCARIQDPVLVERMVRNAMIAVSSETIQTLLRMGPPPEDPARAQIDSLLAALDQHGGFTRALRGELFLGRASLPRSGEGWRKLLKGKSTSGPSLLSSLTLLPFLKGRLHLVEVDARAIRASKLPAGQVGPALEEIVQEVTTAPPSVFSLPFARKMLPNLASAWDVEREVSAKLRETRLALRLAARGGELPAKLASVGPVPTDPFLSGHPLRWRLIGPREGLIWSVGPNGKDDGGQTKTDDVAYTLKLPAEPPR